MKDSSFGIVGLETAFSVLYTELVKKDIITLEKLIELMAINPRKRFGIPLGSDYTVWDLSKKTKVDSDKFLSMGKSTPFENRMVFGKCILTVCDGKPAYKAEEE